MRILVPLDEAELATHAFEHALSTYPDAEFTVLHVIHPFETDFDPEVGFPDGSEGEWFETARRDAETLFDGARELAAAEGKTLSTACEIGRPARTIVAYAEDHDIDHIVMGSHGRSGLARVLLGSVAESVVRRSPVPVTIIR
jgi:nucleotide-binding universal stress UspA family protein